MVTINFSHRYFQKTYFRNVEATQYDSFLDLIWELFASHQFENKEIELQIYSFLTSLGYASLEQVPKGELQIIADHFLERKEDYKINPDEEKLTYLLLAAIQRGELIPYFDKKIIEDLKAPIRLRANSVIAFINKNKIENITFKTI